VRTVQLGPLTVLPAGALVLGVLAAAVGLGTAALLSGAAVAVVVWLLVDRGSRRARLPRLGAANTITLARAVLALALTALLVQSWTEPVSRALVVALAAGALSTDLVDGRVARARGEVTAFGGALDMEVDAFLILVLSGYAVPLVGPWVLLIGLARYLLLVAGAVWTWLTRPVPARRWAKVVAAVQGIVLTVLAADLLPHPLGVGLTLLSMALLAESFAHQVVTLRLRRHEQPVATPAYVHVTEEAGTVLSSRASGP